VGLEEQTLNLATFGLLQAFDLVEGEFEGVAGCKPGLEQSELDSGWRGRGRSGGCDRHRPTVLLP
jgi:hypothetical protein